MEITASKRASSNAEQVFHILLRDSVIEVFNGVLGPIAGQALADAVKEHASLEIKDVPRRPDLLDQVLVSHLGLAAKVLERRILKTLTDKTAAGVPPREADRFDFASEVQKVRAQFLKRKQAGDQPHALE